MNSYRLILRFEIRKALQSRLTWIALALPALLTVISAWMAEMTRHARSAESTIEGIDSAFLAFSRGASNGFVLGGILLLVYASMIVANEGALQTFKTIMLRAHPRSSWILAKFSLLTFLALGILVAVVVSGLLAGAFFADFGAIAEEGYVIFDADFMRRASWHAVVLVIPPLLALAAFGLMISTLTDHTGIASAGCVGAYIFLEATKSSLGEPRNFLFNTFMPSLIDTSYFQALRGFANGMSDTGWEPEMFWYAVLTPLGSAFAFLAIALLVFERREFAT